ncbi:MAG: hypothetical protein IJY89_06520 [Clostridia bacterium]|nr:hypothetical protein [Clostridia bacterium]
METVEEIAKKPVKSGMSLADKQKCLWKTLWIVWKLFCCTVQQKEVGKMHKNRGSKNEAQKNNKKSRPKWGRFR